jgi:hypothetical protein
MADTIKDGKGTGYLARVDKNNRLVTDAIVTDDSLDATLIGNSYNINTGEITLTNAADTPVLYLKNNETEDLIIRAVAIGLGPTTNGTGGIPKITIVRNPTTGTIITSTPTDVDMNSNRNYGSTKTLTVDAYKGATGDTMTDGTDHLFFYQTTSGRLFATIDEVLPKGSSIGVKIEPQASNDDMTCYAALVCHLFDENRR